MHQKEGRDKVARTYEIALQNTSFLGHLLVLREPSPLLPQRPFWTSSCDRAVIRCNLVVPVTVHGHSLFLIHGFASTAWRAGYLGHKATNETGITKYRTGEAYSVLKAEWCSVRLFVTIFRRVSRAWSLAGR